MDRLREILQTMDVPENRRADLFWLKRNLGIRNREHECFQEALGLISKHIDICSEFCLDYDGGIR